MKGKHYGELVSVKDFQPAAKGFIACIGELYVLFFVMMRKQRKVGRCGFTLHCFCDYLIGCSNLACFHVIVIVHPRIGNPLKRGRLETLEPPLSRQCRHRQIGASLKAQPSILHLSLAPDKVDPVIYVLINSDQQPVSSFLDDLSFSEKAYLRCAAGKGGIRKWQAVPDGCRPTGFLVREPDVHRKIAPTCS